MQYKFEFTQRIRLMDFYPITENSNILENLKKVRESEYRLEYDKMTVFQLFMIQ